MKKIIRNHFININLKKKIILTIVFFAIAVAMMGIKEYAIANEDCSEKYVSDHPNPDKLIRECTTFLGTENYDIEEEVGTGNYYGSSILSLIWNNVTIIAILSFFISLIRVIVHPLLNKLNKASQQLEQEKKERLEKEKEKNFKETGFRETDVEKRRREEKETERREIQEAAEDHISEGTLPSYQFAKTLYIDNAFLFGENHYKRVSELNMKIAKELERLLRYEEAIETWEDLENHDEAARVRKLKAEQGAVKITQKVVHGDEVTKTEIKDSVLNRSNIGASSDDKVAKLEKISEMKEKGLIDDDEFKQMKKEILGK